VKKIFIILLLFCQFIPAQEKDAVPNDVVVRLRQAWNQFDYAKSTQLLNLALGAIEHYPSDKQTEIYKFAAFIAFQNNNRALASNHFWNLLSIDPTFTLDPVTTPPKILTLFQKTKIDYLEEMQTRLSALQQQQEALSPSMAFLAPGLEQWQRGYKTKGALFSSSAAAALGGLVYSYFDSRQKKDAYTRETDPANIAGFYDSYNAAYKRQFLFAYALAGIWAASQIDLSLWSPVKLSAAVMGTSVHPTLLVSLSWQL